MVSRFISARVAGPLLLLVPSLAVGLQPRERANSAEPAASLPSELQYVPADSAFFLHADAANLWSGSLGKTLRGADPETFNALAASTKKLFGATPDALKSITVFVPKFKDPRNDEAVGVVLVFNAAYDKAKLKAGFDQLLPKNVKSSLETPSDKLAVLLIGLDPKTYGKPQPQDKPGPLTATIREAGTGKHVLVAGTTLANLPDEIRNEDLDPNLRGFRPLLMAETITGIVDLDKDLSVEVRVKATSPPRAGEAEKSLGLLAKLLQETLGTGLKELSKDASKDPAVKDIATILAALQSALKDAKFSTEGEMARATAKVSLDQPFAGAFLDGKRKVREAAARAQSSNNLKQIVLGMHNYLDANGSLPPGAVCDKTGKPLLSWRVLILPYIEGEALYKEFKLDEPWDSDHNKKLIAKMPKTYANPSSTTAKANETHYRAFVGNGAAFDYLKGAKLPQDFQDGTSNTLLVVTAKDSVPWSKPDELDFDPDKDMRELLGFFPNDGCVVALGDGSVRSLNKKISKITLHGAITRSGGEVLGEDF